MTNPHEGDALFDSIRDLLRPEGTEPDAAPLLDEGMINTLEPISVPIAELSGFLNGSVDLVDRIFGHRVELPRTAMLNEIVNDAFSKRLTDALKARSGDGKPSFIAVSNALSGIYDDDEAAVEGAYRVLASLLSVAIFCRTYGITRATSPNDDGTFFDEMPYRVLAMGELIIRVVNELALPIRAEDLHTQSKKGY